MDDNYTAAKALYNDGDYEAAKLEMAKSTTVSPEEYKDFIKQCNALIVEQYRYLINDALNDRDYSRANDLRNEFIDRHGRNAIIESIDIPNIIQDGDTCFQNEDSDHVSIFKKVPIVAWIILALIVIPLFFTLARKAISMVFSDSPSENYVYFEDSNNQEFVSNPEDSIDTDIVVVDNVTEDEDTAEFIETYGLSIYMNNVDTINAIVDYSFFVSDKLTDIDLNGLSRNQLRLIRNTIYAMHGRKFKSAELQDYFNQFDWYEPRVDEVEEYMLTDIDKENLEKIKEYEQ